MARNQSKYLYLELALLRGSPLFHALLEDAAASGKPAALVAAQRLADYYRAPDRTGAGRLSPPLPVSSVSFPENPSQVPSHQEGHASEWHLSR